MFQDLGKLFKKIISSTRLIFIFAIVTSFVIAVAVVGSGNKYIAVILPSLVLFPILIFAITDNRVKRALWELVLCYFAFVVFVQVVTTWAPLNGALSLAKGFHTAGYEVPKNALLIDMVELIACALFALLSAGFGGLIIITRELNAIAYTSANFYMNADKPVLAMLLAWTPWGLLKVLSMLMLTVALCPVIGAKFFDIQKAHINQQVLLVAIGFAMLGLFLRIVLSSLWLEMILRCGIVL